MPDRNRGNKFSGSEDSSTILGANINTNSDVVNNKKNKKISEQSFKSDSNLQSNTQRLHSNVKFVPIPESLSAEGRFRKDFPSYIEGAVESSPGGYVTSPVYAEHAEDILNFKPRPDDVFLLSFPKTGSTWTQDMVWLLKNNCNFEEAQKTSILSRSPFLEMNCMLPRPLFEKYERDAIVTKTGIPTNFVNLLYKWNVMDYVRPVILKIMQYAGQVLRDLDELERMRSPRVIKSHLPFYLLNPDLLETSKVIYMARNPKDVIVSFYHFHKLMDQFKYTGDLATFAEYFMNDRVYSAPFFPHLLDAWSKRNHPNMLFLFYEDLKRDLRGEIQKIASFLNTPVTDDQLDQLVQHLRIDQFSKNKAVNYEMYRDLSFMSKEGKFIRNGKTGDWKNHFSPELNAKIDAWIEKNLKGSDLSFITELEQQD